MRIAFLGAARTVTGSMHLLEVNGMRLLLECGLFQGHRQEAFERNRQLPFDAATIDAMVLSHAHIDHSGNIPNLVQAGFDGPIYATHATRDLCSAMLRDSAYIMESDAAYLNRKQGLRGEQAIQPIYTQDDATHSMASFVSVGYQRPLPLGSGVTLTFYDAGHILGSAFVALDVREGERSYRLMFTGDMGRRGLAILHDPELVPDVDYLITESTYGGRLHGTLQDAEGLLRKVIVEAVARGGKVIIPAFAVGRTQELVYGLHRLATAGDIPDVPIFVDSPLAIDVTDIFRLHAEYYDAEARAFMLQVRDPFGFERLRYTRWVEESKALNDLEGPAVIISASGMCEAGRILHHLKNNIESSRNTILFVGYQAEHTLGRRILNGDENVPILGGRYNVQARIASIDGYSAHADEQELLSYVRTLNAGRIRRAFVVHGDLEACESIARGLGELGVKKVTIPEPGQQVEI
jgi:metallo-beta-lactamase family protein